MMHFHSCLRAVIVVALCLLPALVPAQENKGKKVALLVGVRAYKHANLPDLKHTENDVEELAGVLGTKTNSFNRVVVLSSTRGQKATAALPTAANIRAELKALLAKVTRHDLVLVGLAGHGLQLTIEDPATKKERSESFFCPTDARPRDTKDLAELRQTMLPISELFEELDASGAGVKLMLVDACRNEVKLGRNIDIDALPRPTKGMAAMFSCKGGERAFESDKLGHGVFFHHVIEGLKGGATNNEGEVTWGTLSEYVAKRVSRQVPTLIGGGAKQTPHEIKNIEGESPILIPPSKAAVVKDKGKPATPEKPKSPRVVPEGWTQLFDGTTTKGWKGAPLRGKEQPLRWKVEDDALIGSGQTGPCLSERDDYQNFHLKVEVKLNEKTNAHLVVRGIEPSSSGNLYGYGINITTQPSGRTGVLTMQSKTRLPGPPQAKIGKTTPMFHKADEWFTLDVYAIGDTISVKVAGKETARWTDPNHNFKKGHIALQKQGSFGIVRFRKIEVREFAEK